MLDRKEIVKIIYPTVSTLFIISLGIIMLFVGKYLSQQINVAIGSIPPEVSLTSRVDMTTYEEAVRRLNLISTPEEPREILPENSQTELPPITSPTNIAVTITSPSSLSLAVLNGAGTAGLAGQYKTILADAKYNVTRIGNETKLTASTIIKIKASKEKARVDLVALLGKTLIIGEPETLPETNLEDIVVVIGSAKK